MKTTAEIFNEGAWRFKNEELSKEHNWVYAHAAAELGGVSIEINSDYSPRFKGNNKETRVEGKLLSGPEKHLYAYIRWKSTSRNSIAKYFPLSFEGYQQACAWLDEKRQEFANRILEWDE